MDLMSHISLSPGLIDDLEAFMAPGGDECYAQAQTADVCRLGGHQLPESPPDSGSEHPYSPQEPHTITVSHITSDYMLVPEHVPTHEILQQNGNYIYEELKSDNIDHDILRNNLNDVVVMPQDTNIMELGSVRHDLGLDSLTYSNRYNQIRVEMSDLEQGIINPQLVSLAHDTLTPVYANQEPSNKKRKHSQDVNSQVKCEPAALSPENVLTRPAPPSVDGSEAGDDSPLQCIRFSQFQQSAWHALYDCNLKPIPTISYVVGADKGFNYSQIDEAFVCQKKNHFQVTCQIQAQGDPLYVKTPEGYKKINSFRLHFYGVKAEDPSQEVRVEQSQSDRTKKPFHPVPVELRREGTKVTVCRLHFAETTNNNMRKKGRPNPDQRHFQLVVALRAHVSHGHYMLAAHASDRIIVRASNPGQFESDCTENWWQRGVLDNTVHFNGRVGINTDKPDESCVINGNLKVMGHIVQPSDARAKHDIEELDTAQQLVNIQNIRVVKFNYDQSFAQHSGLLGFDPSSLSPQSDTGVIAQEVRKVLPEAVKEAGDVTLPNGDTINKFLVVNKDRIFMENLGAVKELCKVTGNLESRIDQLERINKKLCKISVQRRDSARSSISNDSRFSSFSNTSKSFYNDCNVDHIRDIARNIRKHECCHKLSHNSPKYTRKQCKNCHGSYSKYGRYYNYNKTCVKKDKSDSPTFNDTFQSSPVEKTTDESLSVLKNNDNCIWLRDDDFACGNSRSRLMLCCPRKDRFSDDSELISNKFLQIIITILIFIMAVCLVVMSALYFREHQELLSMREIRQNKHTNYGNSYYGKFNMNNPLTHRATPPDSNQIHNPKLSQHLTAKKTAKEKVSVKSPPELTITESAHISATTTNSVKELKQWNPESAAHAPVDELQVKTFTQHITKLVGNCAFIVNTDNKLDECSSACLDPPQTYENQEPQENNDTDKDNETFSRPLEPRDHAPSIPVIPERNNTSLKTDNDSIINQLSQSISSNSIDTNKQNVTETLGRLKREVWKRKHKREINDALDSGSKDWTAEQDEDWDCEKTSFGMWSSSASNSSVVSQPARCMDASIHNYTYRVPLDNCPRARAHLHLTFRTSKKNVVSLCDFRCKPDTTDGKKSCQAARDTAPPVLNEDMWRSKIALDCATDTFLKLRAGGEDKVQLCALTPRDKIQFTEYNIHLMQSCHN